MNGTYDPYLVAASVVVAILASYTALDLARSVTSASGRARSLWLFGGSLAMGFGIWSMHFVGMLAFTLPGVAISYDVPLLVLSVVVAVVASAIALWVASRDAPGVAMFSYGGLAMGAAICGMHYIGMWGMRMPATIAWRASLVVASILIATGASFAALWLAFRLRAPARGTGFRNRMIAALVMGIAIAGMHYTAMFAAVFRPLGGRHVVDSAHVLATDGLGVSVIGSTVLILAVALAGSIMQRELARRAAVLERVARLYEEAQTEIAERQRVEQALRERDERLRLALDAGAMGTWEWSAPEQRLIVSDACRSMHGLDDDFDGDVNGMIDIVHPEDRDLLRRAFRALIDEGTPCEVEYRVRTTDGEVRWLHARGRRFGEGASRRTIGICADVTANRVMEERLRQSQKLEAVGHLAGGIAHDFNNILTAVQGNVELLLGGLAGNDPRRQEAEEIRRASLRAAELTRQLLGFARRQVVQPRRLDLADHVERLLPMLRRLIGEDVRTTTQLATGQTPIHADPSQIEQIVLNLVLNARDAMPGGGRLTLEAQPRMLTEPVTAGSETVAEGNYAVLTVGDDGTGMPPDVLEHIFEPFFTTKPPGQGTGLGLSTVHGIVKQAGAFIDVDTEFGEGTRFQVYFRAADATAAGARAASESEAEGRQHSSTTAPAGGVAARSRTTRASILVAEDEPSVGSLVQRALTRAGFRVVLAADGALALQAFIEDPAEFDLVVTDVVMPNMGGRELVDRLRAIRPEMPVLFISGYTRDAVLQRGVAEADADLLLKPFSPDQLVERVVRALGRAHPA